MVDEGDRRGILYPTRLPEFHRVPPPAELDELVRWFWIPSWDLAPGRTSRQTILPFPASNLVVGPDGVVLAGPTTGVSHRNLRGRGWAVGALLRPAAAASLQVDLAGITDAEVEYRAPQLHEAVTDAMRGEHADPCGLAAQVFCSWVSSRMLEPDEAGLLANRMEHLISSDRTIVRVDQLAEKLSISVRSVQRLAHRTIGLPPLSVIRRYRLQEASQRLRDSPDVSIGQIAAELGYSDHAHLTADFRSVLGFTPTSYRRDHA